MTSMRLGAGSHSPIGRTMMTDASSKPSEPPAGQDLAVSGTSTAPSTPLTSRPLGAPAQLTSADPTDFTRTLTLPEDVAPVTLLGARDEVLTDDIEESTITFGIGPAGTGKTYLAMAKAVDILAYFDHPGSSDGPTEAVNGRLEHLRGIALGFRNLASDTTRSLIHVVCLKDHLASA